MKVICETKEKQQSKLNRNPQNKIQILINQQEAIKKIIKEAAKEATESLIQFYKEIIQEKNFIEKENQQDTIKKITKHFKEGKVMILFGQENTTAIAGKKAIQIRIEKNKEELFLKDSSNFKK